MDHLLLSRLLPRVELITKLLLSKGVMTKDKLIEIWNDDSKCKHQINVSYISIHVIYFCVLIFSFPFSLINGLSKMVA